MALPNPCNSTSIRICFVLAEVITVKRMAASRLSRLPRTPARRQAPLLYHRLSTRLCPHARQHIRPQAPSHGLFSTSAFRSRPQSSHRKETFSARLRAALGGTRIQWRPIPVSLGIAFVGGTQLYRLQRRQYAKEAEDAEALRAQDAEDAEADKAGRPRRRERVRPSGPWSVASGTPAILKPVLMIRWV